MTGQAPCDTTEVPRVLFVVPTFNRAADLPRTIGAIAAQDWPDDRKAILVVDNSSTDDTAAVLASLAQSIACPLEHLVKAPEGPTVARNLGIARGQAGLVALVDSDVELDPGWTRAAAAALLADPGLAMAGGPLVYGHDPGLVNSYGGATGFLGLSWDREEGHALDAAAEPRDVLWLNTSAVLLRPMPVLAAGGYDEQFFLAYEEPDLGLRLALAGWRARVVPGAVARHHVVLLEGQLRPEMIIHVTKNRIRMGMKVWGPARLMGFLLLNAAFSVVDVLLRAPRAARLRGVWWNIVHIGDTLRLRQAAQAARRVPDAVVARQLDARWFPPTRLRGQRRRPVRGMRSASGPDDRFVAGDSP